MEAARKITKEEVIALELEKIRKKNKNKALLPEEVVSYAKDKNNPLHDYFTWNNKEAGDAYRLEEARALIRRVKVERPANIVPIEFKMPITRDYVSLSSDRREGNGYRKLNIVLHNKLMRKELIEDAKKDMDIFIRKYSTLKELSNVILEMKKLQSED